MKVQKTSRLNPSLDLTAERRAALVELFEHLNMPPAVRALTYMIPARYYVTLLQTLFLAGDIPSVIIPCCITLGVFAVVLMGIARLKAPKSLE